MGAETQKFDDTESVARLDEMLGLVREEELTDAVSLPVIVQLKTQTADWYVLAGMRRRSDDYYVQGLVVSSSAKEIAVAVVSLDSQWLSRRPSHFRGMYNEPESILEARIFQERGHPLVALDDRHFAWTVA